MVTIKVRKNGPYLVTGGVELTDAEGNPIEPKNKGNYVLCRCGHSQTKPFCDGAHKTACFDDES
jgi:CDGSH-type Zn-finger protein